MNEKIFAVLIGANSKYERDRLIMRLIGNSVKEYSIINRNKENDKNIMKLMDGAAEFFGFDKRKESRAVEEDKEDNLLDIEIKDINNEDERVINKNSRFYVAR